MTQVQSDEWGAKVRFPPPFVYLASLLLGIVFRYVVAPFPIPVNRYVGLAGGVALFLAGLWLNFGAWTFFKRAGQDPKPWTPSPELVLCGPYRFTRNPMYVGMTCMQLGLGLALDNLWIGLLAPFSLLVVHFLAVLPEEKYLSEKFGDSYRAYLIRVRRYI